MNVAFAEAFALENLDISVCHWYLAVTCFVSRCRLRCVHENWEMWFDSGHLHMRQSKEAFGKLPTFSTRRRTADPKVDSRRVHGGSLG